VLVVQFYIPLVGMYYCIIMLQVSSLCHVVELLKSKGVEPAMRRSALTQVSVMLLEDNNLHDKFLEQDGVTLILDILQKALVSCAQTCMHDCQRSKTGSRLLTYLCPVDLS